MAAPEIADGFPGQRIVVLPRSVVAQALPHPLLGGMIPTDVGYFPKATHHAFERTEGIVQAVLIYCVMGGGSCRTAARRVFRAINDVSPSEYRQLRKS